MKISIKNVPLKLFLVLLCLVDFVVMQCADQIACFAPPMDVSKNTGFKLNVDSECGIPAEDFCVGIDCSLKCDSTKSALTFPATNMLDSYELETYWKSKNFDEPVSIVFDLGSKMILHQITITFKYDFPNGLYIQKSNNDGSTYLTLMYYAIRCNDTFGLHESSFYNRLDVLCFKLSPSSDAQQQLYQVRLIYCTGDEGY